MRVTQRMAETLVVEDAPDRLFGWMLLGFGLFGVLVAGAQGANWLFGIVGTVFALFGLWKLVVARTITHRFDRGRGLMTMESTGPWRASRRERELRLDSIADVILEKKHVRGGEAGVRYWVEYVTTQGEHIPWSAFTSSKDDKIGCVQAVREFLGIATRQPPPN